MKVISEDRQILGFSVLKNGAFLQGEIEKLSGPTDRDNWKLLTQYAYGRYGKRDATIDAFIKTFYEHTQIPLDFVYTGKMMCGIFDLIQDGYFTRGTTILAIHTGGLQGHS